MNHLKYSTDHVWVYIDNDGTATVGISDYAQEQLGDIVYVQLPEVGRDVVQGEEAIMIESVKTTGEVKLPLGGRVVEVNETLAEHPERVNESPLEDAWLVKLEPFDEGELDDLMDSDDYEDFLSTLS